ncbi:MAG: sensor histidine kinase, partial [Chloroflexi bacterium]|nr:sensor histidine kinase [Chloroflexota bacterium]
MRLLGRMSLQTKVLLIQIGIVVLVAGLISTTVISVLANLVEQQAGERALGIGEAVALMPEVRNAFDAPDPSAELQPLAESVRQAAGVSFVVISNRDLIRYTHPNRELIGRSLLDPPPAGGVPEDDAKPLRGEPVVVQEEGSLGRSIRAKVPIYNTTGTLVGAVSVGILVERVQDRLARDLPALAATAAAALLAGIGVSFLLARHIKGQTLGLEPAEIAALFEQREAMLHGIREGVVAVDRAGQITVVNDEARRLLRLPDGVEGWPVAEVIPDSGLPRVLTSGQSEADQSTQLNGRWIVVSRIPVRIRGKLVGAIATFRDRTEFEELALELQGTRSYLNTLRAQAHEFANKLHTIAGLLELGWEDQAVAFITQTTREQQQWIDELPTRIADPELAALLVGKASVASERGISFSVSEHSKLSSAHRASGLRTILGNLIENAFDAVDGQARRDVVVSIEEEPDELHVEVRDSGPGVPEALLSHIFESGFSTKSTDPGSRGFGLALVHKLVETQGGKITVHNDGGAVFEVHLPRRVVAPPAPAPPVMV